METVKCGVTGKDVPVTKWELETIIRWDEGTCELLLYTASPVQARRWERAGVAVKSHGWRGWEVIVDKREWRISLRKARRVMISNKERERRREQGRAALAKAHESRRRKRKITNAAAGE